MEAQPPNSVSRKQHIQSRERMKKKRVLVLVAALMVLESKPAAKGLPQSKLIQTVELACGG